MVKKVCICVLTILALMLCLVPEVSSRAYVVGTKLRPYSVDGVDLVPGGFKVVFNYMSKDVLQNVTTAVNIPILGNPDTDSYDAIEDYTLAYSGSIIGISIKSNAPVTTGTLSAEVFNNGRATGLKTGLDITNTLSKSNTQNRGLDTVVANDAIQVKLDSSSDLAPSGSMDVVVTVYVSQ